MDKVDQYAITMEQYKEKDGNPIKRSKGNTSCRRGTKPKLTPTIKQMRNIFGGVSGLAVAHGESLSLMNSIQKARDTNTRKPRTVEQLERHTW